MKSVNKSVLLIALGHQIEGHIQQAVVHFQNMDEVTLCQPSPSGGWSIAQCLDHLNSYGRYYLPRLNQGLASRQHKPTTDRLESSWLGAFLVRLMDPKTGTKKFRAVKRHQPANDLPAHQIVAEFIEQQEQLLDVLKQVENANVDGIQIALSIASWLHLPIGNVLQFLVIHTERHIRQANRNLPSV
ncbi:DinB family protein [Spirosoma sp.]|uniref:DinB family protein n=1 Tax=Spirosoma sp. TaxID=1899569 RepID=UPI00262C0ABA|nr:DinB family protein [Spirosoma sp.]MCX6216923.1 DinB family protein [Spirosoma sp.]